MIRDLLRSRAFRAVATVAMLGLNALLLFHLGGYIIYRYKALQHRSAGVLPLRSTSSSQPANLCVMSTVLSLDEVDGRVWDSFEDWCESANTEIFIVFKSGRVPDERLRNCVSVHLRKQPQDLPKNRIERIAALRNIVKQIPVAEGKRLSKFDAVVVIDMDVETLPSWEEMANALTYMDKEKEGLDIVCCNGYETYLGMDQVYDLYPFVFKENSRWLFAELDFFAYLTFLQPLLFEEINGFQGVFPLRSCFGGLALYNPELYLSSQCNYDTLPNPLQHYAGPDGHVCEHLVLHECMRHYHPDMLVGILPNLPVKRTCAWTEALVPPLYFVLVVIALTLCRYLQVARRWPVQLRRVHQRTSDADIKSDGNSLGIVNARAAVVCLVVILVFVPLALGTFPQAQTTRIRSISLRTP